MQERHLCWLPYLFPWPRSAPHFFIHTTVTPVSHPLTRLIHISPSCWTIYRSFEITLEMGTVHWVELKIQCSIQIHCFRKNIQSRYELCFKKYSAALDSSDSNEWARVKREPTKLWESLLQTILFYSRPATCTREARHRTKIYEQWKCPKIRGRVNNLVKWDRGWWNKHTKQASLRSPMQIIMENSGEARGARVPV